MRTKIDIRRAITERGYTITSFCQKFDLKTQNIIQNYIKGNPTIKVWKNFARNWIATSLICSIQ